MVVKTNDDEGMHLIRYFIGCMEYPQTAKLIINRSNLWISMMYYISEMMDKINNWTEYHIEGEYNVGVLYQDLSLIIFQILRNIVDKI